jgi:hypothetical protein
LPAGTTAFVPHIESHCKFNGLRCEAARLHAEVAGFARYFTQNRRKIPVVT